MRRIRINDGWTFFLRDLGKRLVVQIAKQRLAYGRKQPTVCVGESSGRLEGKEKVEPGTQQRCHVGQIHIFSFSRRPARPPALVVLRARGVNAVSASYSPCQLRVAALSRVNLRGATRESNV